MLLKKGEIFISHRINRSTSDIWGLTRRWNAFISSHVMHINHISTTRICLSHFDDVKKRVESYVTVTNRSRTVYRTLRNWFWCDANLQQIQNLLQNCVIANIFFLLNFTCRFARSIDWPLATSDVNQMSDENVSGGTPGASRDCCHVL